MVDISDLTSIFCLIFQIITLLVRGFDLDKNVQNSIGLLLGQIFLDLFSQTLYKQKIPLAINCFDDKEIRHDDFFDFVGLKMAYEVPLDIIG